MHESCSLSVNGAQIRKSCKIIAEFILKRLLSTEYKKDEVEEGAAEFLESSNDIVKKDGEAEKGSHAGVSVSPRSW